MNIFDMIIIGAGPGGYVAAIKAAKSGFKVAVIEEDRVGGTCLNRGCIPTKVMLHASSLYSELKESERFGIFSSGVSFDYKKIMEYKNETVDKLCQGVEQLFKSNRITLIKGKATLEKDRSVSVVSESGKESYKADKVILATGSKPALPPISGIESEGVVTSDELFKLTEIPKRLIIIGGGVIGTEFASVFSALGTEVTILESLPNILGNIDKDITQNLKLIMKKRGVDIHTSVNVKKIEKDDEELCCIYTEKDKDVEIRAECILCAAGRIPNTEGLFGEGVDLSMEKGRIIVDEKFKTDMDGVYAIGDLIKGMQLAHLASAQGICLIEELAGHERSIELSVVPSCIYTEPEIAVIGISESEAKENGIPVKVGKFIMNANSKSVISKEERGIIKIIADERTEKIIGAHMMCARATDMIGEFGSAITNRMTVSDLLKCMRAHPTYNEGVGEALEEVYGSAIHVVPKIKL